MHRYESIVGRDQQAEPCDEEEVVSPKSNGTTLNRASPKNTLGKNTRWCHPMPSIPQENGGLLGSGGSASSKSSISSTAPSSSGMASVRKASDLASPSMCCVNKTTTCAVLPVSISSFNVSICAVESTLMGGLPRRKR